ncbi:MAG: hypothetical protein IKR90_01180 [Clostridia bacterium]|nr:hypothetical protein [Clostridia bacterium]
MKKTVKTAISVFLCLTILAAAAAPAFAANEKIAFVAVSGMNTFPLYDENNNKVYPLSGTDIAGLAFKLLPYITDYLVSRNADRLADKVLPAVYDAFEPIACLDTGESKYNLHTDLFDSGLVGEMKNFESHDKDEEGIVNRAAKKYGVENTFFFNYDWRLDPIVHADRLNKFIGFVKEKTGCKRVALAAFSMGGTVTCSYLNKYGSGDLASVELCSTAFQGTSIVGDLFRGKLEVDVEALFHKFAQLTRDPTFTELIDYINEGLTLNGFNVKVTDFANDIIEAVGDRIYNELFIPVFGYMPGLWALCDYEHFNQCKNYILKDGADKKLINRINSYHAIQGSAKSILSKAMKNTNVYIIAQYGMQGNPVSERCTKSNNDYMIDCVYASGGATCSDIGKTLGSGYKQKKYAGINYLSADGQIDASTCLFPDKTWFIKNMGHVDYPEGEGADFILWFAEQKDQKTVFNCKYPQFQNYSYKTGKLTPVADDAEETGVLHPLLAFLAKIRAFIYSLKPGNIKI